MTLLKCLLILVQCKTYFHMHYVSMQPNKKTKKKKRLQPCLCWDTSSLHQGITAPANCVQFARIFM